MNNNESPAALLPDEAVKNEGMTVGGFVPNGTYSIRTSDVSCRIVDERFAQGWNECRRTMQELASTAPVASESRGSVPDGEEGAFTARVVEWKGIRFGVPASIAKSFMTALEGTNGEPPDWAIAQVLRELDNSPSVPEWVDPSDVRGWDACLHIIVSRARELARSAAAKGEG
jgi:hypothetical protein